MSKVAVVTGASKGIGAATALAFAKEGYDVVVNYLQDEVAAQKVAHDIHAAGQKAVLVQADMSTEKGVNKLFAVVKKDFGTVDVLVNNVGFAKEPPFGEWTMDAISASFAGNIGSALLCSQAVVPLMPEGGSILFNSSIYGLPFGGNPGIVLYSAAKAAIVTIAQTLAEKLKDQKIRCNAVAPGQTRTPAWDSASPKYVAGALGMTLQNQWVEPQEIASAFVFLAKTPHCNAQTIVIDSGWQKKIRPAVSRK